MSRTFHHAGSATHTHTVAHERVTHRDEFGARIVQTCACGKIRIRYVEVPRGLRGFRQATAPEAARCA